MIVTNTNPKKSIDIIANNIDSTIASPPQLVSQTNVVEFFSLLQRVKGW